MPSLEIRKPMTAREALLVARQLAMTTEHGLTEYDTYTVTLDAEHCMEVGHVLVWKGSPHMATLAHGGAPLMIICPYCRTDVNGWKRHSDRGCPRPVWLYTHAECGQPDYGRGWGNY
jgi:hypothetical protein